MSALYAALSVCASIAFAFALVTTFQIICSTNFSFDHESFNTLSIAFLSAFIFANVLSMLDFASQSLSFVLADLIVAISSTKSLDLISKRLW